MTNSSTEFRHQIEDWLSRHTPTSGVRRVIPVSAALGSDVGVVRSENQDRVVAVKGADKSERAYSLIVVADGIGGMKDGARCAAKGIAALVCAVHMRAQVQENPGDWLRAGFEAANQFVHESYRGSGGTTLVAALTRGDGNLFWASVGDSRLYSYEPQTGLSQISRDDTIAGQLGRHPDIGSEQSKLLQFIGMGAAVELEVECLSTNEGASVVLTTDGTHFLERAGGVFQSVISNAPDSGTCARRLIELSKWCGGPDNASVAAVNPWVDLSGTVIGTSSIDIWDPFGEVRIIETAPLTKPYKTIEVVQDSQPVKPNVVEIESTEASSEPASESEVTTFYQSPLKRKPSAKSEKKDKKPRKKVKKKAGTAMGDKPGQVQLEFSDKDA